MSERNGRAKVFLLSTTYDPQRVVASAAKLCYSSSDIESLVEKQSEEKIKSFINMLVEMGHESPIEHAVFTFGIENVSRALLAQITRHRIASFSVQSQRYVKSSQFDFITPPRIEAIPEALEIYDEYMAHAQATYDKLAKLLADKEAVEMFGENPTEEQYKKAEKAVLEDARFVLPNGAATKMVLTMNARSLMNFFAHRCCNRAQWEIRALAEDMLKLCLEVAPDLFNKAGPSCICEPCPEGKMTCGKMLEMREKYAKMRNGEDQ